MAIFYYFYKLISLNFVKVKIRDRPMLFGFRFITELLYIQHNIGHLVHSKLCIGA